MKGIFPAAILVATLAAAGCTTVGPDYARPQISLPGDFSLNENKAEPHIPGEWWRLYGDSKLDALVAATLANNADLRFAAARVEEAEGVLREAGAAFFPEVTGGYSFGRNRVSTRTVPPPAATAPLTRPQYQLLASTSFELDFWGRYSRADEAARANLLNSRYSRDVVGLTLASAAAQSYFGLRSLDAQLAVLALTIGARNDSLELARARLNAGIASALDVLQAQGALSDALVQRRETGRQRAILERQLGQLTGQLDLRVQAGELFALPVPPTPPAGLPSALLDRRPDIRAAEESLAASNAQIGVARAALFPAISLTGALGAQSAMFSNLLGSGAGIWSLGYALALPIFDGGRRDARVDQAVARQHQALAGYQKAVETGFREVSEGLTNVAESGAAETELAARLKAARDALEFSNLRYEAGYSPFLEVLDAQRTANEAELAFVRNRQSRLSYSVDLMKALGGGWIDREPRAAVRPASP
jgi:multidrug efflux system outer membrane protein